MSTTAVPIQPIQKGSLTKYWVGVALVALVALTLAYLGTHAIPRGPLTNATFLKLNGHDKAIITTKSGLQYQVIKGGEGPSPGDNDVAIIGYRGAFRDGKVFDQNPQAPMPVTGVIPGFSEALKLMQSGGQYRLWIPSDLAYGPKDKTNPQTGEVMMPGNSVLIFDVAMMNFMPREEFEKQMKAAQEEQKKRGGASAGAGAGAPAGGASAGGAPEGLPPEIQQQIDAQMQGQQGL
jgi:FKBP-type peptidyl-prolyl cis-trans isomerase FkpA